MSPTGVLVAAGGLFGMLGVILSARATHGGDGPQLAIAAQFLLFHAPVFLGIAALRALNITPRLIALAAGLLAFGLVLFCGDLTVRALLMRPLLVFAAPAGGFALIAGWLMLLIAGLQLITTRKN
jgi:uncharacterized membrane protein YgdD (TMEM256/DUF423 family)